MKNFCLLLLCCLLLSCRKTYQKTNAIVNEDPDNLKEQLLGSWKLYAQTSNPENDWNGDGITETNMFSTYNNCQKENGLIFQPEGKGMKKNSCADSVAINWKITNSSNDFQYTFQLNGQPRIDNNKIIQLNQRYFIFSGSMQAANGKTFTIISRYLRQ